jgi:hypothetical protein
MDDNEASVLNLLTHKSGAFATIIALMVIRRRSVFALFGVPAALLLGWFTGS